MEYRSKKIPASLDAAGSIANDMVMQATGSKLMVLSSHGVTDTGASAASCVSIPLMLIPKSVNARWRVVGVGAYIYADGATTIAESFTWGHYVSDLGAMDVDAFGSIVCTTTGSKQLVDGDFIYQGIAPFDDYFQFDALANAGSHTWDISGTGAGVLMGEWRTKSTQLVMLKAHVGSSTATGFGFFLIEYEIGGGIT